MKRSRKWELKVGTILEQCADVGYLKDIGNRVV